MVQFDVAEDYYSGFTEQFPGTPLAVAAHANLARMYDEVGRWNDEIAQLEALSDTTSEALRSVQIRMADIYGMRLKKYDRALEIYDEQLDNLDPKVDTLLYAWLRYKKARIRLEQGRYGEARDILTDLKQNYRRFFASTPEAQLTLARSFDYEDNWDRAEIEYTYLTENYRGSEEAMAAFLYVAQKLREMGRQAEAERWEKNAEEYYAGVAQIGSGEAQEARALSYLAELQARQEKWDESAATFLTLYEKFPGSEIGRQALARAAVIYRGKLGQPAVGDSLVDVLNSIIPEVPPGPQDQNF
jgi:tetratricopeptide (TPR) repeat protein